MSARVLTSGWARVGLATWMAVLFAEIAAAVSSRTVGKPPWWLGPSVNPAPVFFLAVPVVLVVVPGIMYSRSSPNAPRAGALCAILLAVVAVVDIGRTPGVAVVELVIAVAALFGSLATNAGAFTRL